MNKATNRQQEIILESARLFRMKGYLATSIRDISDSLNITSAALYYHFKNKEEILLAIMRLSLRNLRQAVGDAVVHEENPLIQLQAALRTHLQISIEYQDFAIVLLKDLRHLSPEWQAQVVEARDSYEDMWEELLEECQSAGLLKSSTDLNLLRLLMFGALNLVVTWYKESGKYQPREIADAFLEYLLTGVRESTALPIDFLEEISSSQ